MINRAALAFLADAFRVADGRPTMPRDPAGRRTGHETIEKPLPARADRQRRTLLPAKAVLVVSERFMAISPIEWVFDRLLK